MVGEADDLVIRGRLIVVLFFFVLVGCDGGDRQIERTVLIGPQETPIPIFEVTSGDSSLVTDESEGALDHVAVWLGVGAALLGSLAGLVALWLVKGQVALIRRQLEQTGAEQRMQFLPYIRVDIGPTTTTLSDFEPPVPIHHNEQVSVNLVPGSRPHETVSVSAWFRNLQSHPLGTAYAVRAYFLVELEAEGEIVEGAYIEPFVAYLQYERPVRVTLCRLPKGRGAKVTLQFLSYFDFQNRRQTHSAFLEATNPSHGRFSCIYDGYRFTTLPESWSGQDLEGFPEEPGE